MDIPLLKDDFSSQIAFVTKPLIINEDVFELAIITMKKTNIK